MLSRLICVALGHRWEVHNTVERGDWKRCTRCGVEQDFHPSYDREGNLSDPMPGSPPRQH